MASSSAGPSTYILTFLSCEGAYKSQPLATCNKHIAGGPSMISKAHFNGSVNNANPTACRHLSNGCNHTGSQTITCVRKSAFQANSYSSKYPMHNIVDP